MQPKNPPPGSKKNRSGASRAQPSRRDKPQKTNPGSGASLSVQQPRRGLKILRRQHQLEAQSSLRRLLQEPYNSLLTMLVIAIGMALPAGLLIFLGNLQQLSASLQDGAQISLYLKDQISIVEGQQLASKIEQKNQVLRTNYLSKEQTLEEFQQLSGFGSVLQQLDENPLPAVILVIPAPQAEQANAIQNLLDTLAELPQVDQADLDLLWVKRLYAFTRLGQSLVWAIASLFALAVILIIGNTLRLAIQARQEEILVIKLVGGTDRFIRRPFIYAGAWYGLGGGILAWLLLTIGLIWLSGPVRNLAEQYNNNFQLSGLGGLETLALLLISTILGVIGALLTVIRHIAAIEANEI